MKEIRAPKRAALGVVGGRGKGIEYGHRGQKKEDRSRGTRDRTVSWGHQVQVVLGPEKEKGDRSLRAMGSHKGDGVSGACIRIEGGRSESRRQRNRAKAAELEPGRAGTEPMGGTRGTTRARKGEGGD